jgi:hypothetical protein
MFCKILQPPGLRLRPATAFANPSLYYEVFPIFDWEEF